ncbi:hypothetical protein [Nonomuraea sp. NPDC049709]|uniref:hypothetical protein n=1 Tax=Nonomuraea sp. NPDC049709 TaxID=3154736 RepID=UPI00341E59CC
MTDESQPPSYGPPPGQGPYHGQPRPPQYGPQPGSQPGYGPQPGSQPGYGPQPGSQPGPGQPPQGQPPHGQPPYGQPPFGQPPQYGQLPQYGQPTQFGPPPQYGQYGQQPQFPPRIDSKAIKPRLWWLAAAWGVFVVCAVVGVLMFTGGVVSSVADLAPTRTFASGESVTVPVDPADKPAVYIASDTQVTYDCAITGGPGQARLAKTAGTQKVTVNGAVWEQFLVINAPAKGDYQLTCTNQEQATVRYGVGRDALSAVGGITGGLAALVLVPGAGLLVAIAGTITVLVRRSGARKRLAVSG